MPAARKTPTARPRQPRPPTVVRIENPAWLVQPPSRGLARPATQPLIETLPFLEIGWENFERLCYRLARCSGDADQWAALYGSRGQDQQGIDIYARPAGSQRYTCWQARRLERMTVSGLKSAIVDFEAGDWAGKSDAFIICTAAPIQDTRLQLAIESETKRLRAKGLNLFVYGKVELSEELRDKPALVRISFGRDWARDFCTIGEGEAAAALDAGEVAMLREELLTLYTSNFSTLDPGLVGGTGPQDDQAVLPLLDRFIEPDIEVSESGTQFKEPVSPVGLVVSHEIGSDLRSVETARPISTASRETFRRRLSTWIAEGDHSALVGDAGFGKSTSLRVIALDLLGAGSRFPQLTRQWADRIPFLMPFPFWVRLVEKDGGDISLRAAITIWLGKFGVSESLVDLVQRSFDENRIILLIDGLDEWSNAAAARSTLALLDSHVKARRIPAVLSGRPGGLVRLGGLDPMWRHGQLAPLSDSQQRALAAIWFGHLLKAGKTDHSETGGTLAAYVTMKVDTFFADLLQAGSLVSLSGVALLLSALISLFVRKLALPRSRFQAYEELVQLLLEVHPQRRSKAALEPAPRSAIFADQRLLRQSLADFAFQKRLKGLDAGCTIREARGIVRDFLKDPNHGAGLATADAVTGATQILNVDAECGGLLIEKAPEEIGFVHAVFEEVLAGVHLAGWPLDEQKHFIEQHGGDPRWSIAILAMLHALTRPSDVDTLVESLMPQALRTLTDFARQALVAEVIFGNFNCSARLAAKLAPLFLELVAVDTWKPHRQAVAQLVVEAALSGGARGLIREKADEWFPSPVEYRARVYPGLAMWPKDLALPLLWSGLFCEQGENKRAASATLAKIFAGDTVIGDRLFALAHTVCDVRTLCAAIEALFDGWWEPERLQPLIDAARCSDHPYLRLLGIRGRIKAGKQDDADLDDVLALADKFITPRQNTGVLLTTLLTGWPHNSRIVNVALDAVKRHGRRHRIDQSVATGYLLHAAQTDDVVDEQVGQLIREDEHFFTVSMGHSYPSGRYGPAVRSALDLHLDRLNEHFHNDIAHVAVMSGSDHAKQKLLKMVVADDQWVFWPVNALLVGWGMDDPEVAATLTAAAARPPERLQYIAHHLPEIMSDKAKCRARLLEVARLPELGRLDFLVAGLTRSNIGFEDSEVTDTVLAHAFDGRGIFDATDDLFAGFAQDPRVRDMALRRLGDVDAPWGTLTLAYANDPEIRSRITRYLSNAPAWLRSIVVLSLARGAGDDETKLASLAQYRFESDAGVRTAGAIAYYETISRDAVSRQEALATARTEVTATGPYMDTISQAGLAGYIALDELKDFVKLPGWRSDQKLGVDVFTFRGNAVIQAYVARHWDRLTAAAGSDIFLHIRRLGGNEWWDWNNLAPHVGESEALKRDFLDFCRRCQTAISSEGIEALAREMPGSHLLRDHCLRYIRPSARDHNMTPLDTRRGEFVVGRVLARQFPGDVEVRAALEKCAESVSHPSAAIVALSIGWRDSTALPLHFSQLKAERTAFMYVWADAAYLFATLGTRQEFCDFLTRLFARATGNVWDFLQFCIEPIVDRIKAEEGLGEHLASSLMSAPNGTARASLPRLLAAANQMTGDLRAFCEAEFASQSDGTALPAFGLDIMAGEFRPVAHALLDALSG
jgi:hypothetical protein